jgi:hypothetical protein
LGHAQLEPIFFRLAVLVRYQSDPRYLFRFDGLSGHISVKEGAFKSRDMDDADKVLLETFGWVADSVALLTESSVEARIAASKRIKKLYDRRSEIVHAGHETLPRADLEDSLRFCSRSIFETLVLGASWGDCSDEKLFEDLDRRKFA